MQKKVLMVAENPIPAVRRVSRPHYLAQALAESGFAVRTITFPSEARQAIAGCRHTYLPLQFDQFSPVRRLLFFLSFFYAARAIRQDRPSVLHGQGLLPGLVVVVCARLFHLPCVVGMPDFVEILYESFKFPMARLGLRLLVAMENFVAHQANALIVESELAKSEWARRGIDGARVHPIHHAADLSLFDCRVSGEAVRSGYVLDNEVLITYHGDIGSDDGVDILVRAFRTVVEEGLPARLMIIGSGAKETMDELRTLASGLEERVTLTGWVSYRDVPQYLAASDIGVAPFRPTLYTNTVVPTKVLEVMAMNKPAIVSRLTTFSRYVRQREHCLLVEPGNVAELTGALSELVRSPDLRRTLGENGRRLVEGQFTWPIKTREEVHVIEGLIG